MISYVKTKARKFKIHIHYTQWQNFSSRLGPWISIQTSNEKTTKNYPNKYFVLKNIISLHVDKQNFAAYLTLRKGQAWVMTWCGKQPNWNLNNKTNLALAKQMMHAFIFICFNWVKDQDRILGKKNPEFNSEQV